MPCWTTKKSKKKKIKADDPYKSTGNFWNAGIREKVNT